MMSRKSVDHSGFSLIELLVVMVILGLLAGLVGPRLFAKVDTSKVRTAETQIKILKTVLQTYRLDVGSYPSTEQGLAALNARPSGRGSKLWQGPYLDENLPLDPWGNSYAYRLQASNGVEFSLFSYGADGQPKGEGLEADIGYLPQ